jgi:hypothetical protein
MPKFIKLLGILAIVVSSITSAAAATFSAGLFPGTGGTEDFVFSYTSTNSFTLSDLSLSGPGTGNLLAGTLLPFTTAMGGSLGGSPVSGTLSEVVPTTAGMSYTASYSINALPSGDISVSVSPVPLPASFPLFAMALIGLMVVGYRTARTNQQLAV